MIVGVYSTRNARPPPRVTIKRLGVIPQGISTFQIPPNQLRGAGEWSRNHPSLYGAGRNSSRWATSS
ncbi:hypothetical protein CC2G_003358 [Coprinopsis cinerea AmutBmut pab1-1]|nr:hypothetical protein CC2G_003358 [Coprinopsis cinerea AmutBmut pab1-1]